MSRDASQDGFFIGKLHGPPAKRRKRKEKKRVCAMFVAWCIISLCIIPEARGEK
jgi:hypothetical protein